MVNYCCVKGCGRNSRTHPNLTYYSLPKEKERQSQWLTAAHRTDLLKGADLIKSAHRICSRHFDVTLFKNRNRLLCPTATPTLCLSSDEKEDVMNKPLIHEGFECDNCQGLIIGFRYKCLECDNYDLCPKCEVNECHSDHYVLRIPWPNTVHKSKQISKIMQKELNLRTQETDSSDDEPIQKYIELKQNDAVSNKHNLDLDENVKRMLQQHVDGAFKKYQKYSRGIKKKKKI